MMLQTSVAMARRSKIIGIDCIKVPFASSNGLWVAGY